jgi:hypothetical protein
MSNAAIPASHHDLVTAAAVALSTLNDDGSTRVRAQG